MASYTILVPPSASEVSDMERFRLVRDGIAPWAILLWPVWFLAKRLWLGALGVYTLWAILNGGLYLLGVQPAFVALSWGAMLLLIGLEARSVERWTLTRKGWTEIGVTVAGSREEAEERAVMAIAGSVIDPAQRPVPPVQRPVPPAVAPHPVGEPQILGLFPEARR